MSYYAKQIELQRDIAQDLEDQMHDLSLKLKSDEKEQERIRVWGETKVRNLDKDFRDKAIGLLMNQVLHKHFKKLHAKYFYRMLEHSSLVGLSELYKRDMEANQDEFVYVTHQEQQRRQQAMDYLKRAQQHTAIVKQWHQLQFEARQED